MLAKISSVLVVFSSVLAVFSSVVAKISSVVAKISSVLATFSSVLVEHYVYCNSPTQIFPTKTTPLVALILFRTVGSREIGILLFFGKPMSGLHERVMTDVSRQQRHICARYV